MAEITTPDTLSYPPLLTSTRSARGGLRRLRALLTHIPLLTLSIIFGFPFLYLFSTSLKTDRNVFSIPIQWIPDPIAWENYPRALEFIPFLTYFGNTLFITVTNVIFTLISCTLVAYGFARIKWYGRDMMFGVLLATLMIPFTVTLIPQFLLFRQLGWIGSFNPLILPALGGHPFFIFLLRQFYRSIPFELSEAAKIDGASEFGIYWRIILPLSRPALATVAVFTCLWNWNDFLGPLIYLKKDEMQTLAVGLYSYFSVHSSTQWGLLMAAAMVMITPVLILFFVAQRTFIQGISMTGSKG